MNRSHALSPWCPCLLRRPLRTLLAAGCSILACLALTAAADALETETETAGPIAGAHADGNNDGERARRELSERATRAFAAGDWQEANHLYHELLENDPENPLILANLGAVEYQLGDLPASCHYLERALALKDDLTASREMLGMAFHRLNKPLRAVAELARAVADQPESPRARNQLAVILQSLGWYDGAEQSLQRAIQLDPEYGDAHYNLALIYLAREPPSRELARRHYVRARQLGIPLDARLEQTLKDEDSRTQPDLPGTKME